MDRDSDRFIACRSCAKLLERNTDPVPQNIIYVELGTNLEHICPNSDREQNSFKCAPTFENSYCLFIENRKSLFLNNIVRSVDYYNTYIAESEGEKIALEFKLGCRNMTTWEPVEEVEGIQEMYLITTNEHIPSNINVAPEEWVLKLIRKHTVNPSTKGATESAIIENGWKKMWRIGVDINNIIDILDKEHFWDQPYFTTDDRHQYSTRYQKAHWINVAMENEILVNEVRSKSK